MTRVSETLLRAPKCKKSENNSFSTEDFFTKKKKKKKYYGTDGVPQMSSSAPCCACMTWMFTFDTVEMKEDCPAVNHPEFHTEWCNLICGAN